ncbi:MAG: HAMP domain-containing protein [Chloroflexi bacterium]|nr:HAMP domain-containing protein [Chloroflexota bacterium]
MSKQKINTTGRTNIQPTGFGRWSTLTSSQKFTLILLIFMLPLLAFLPIAYEQILQIERYGIKEAQGVVYLRTIWQITDGIQNFYTTNTRTQNGQASATDAENSKRQVDQILQTIRGNNDEIASELDLSFTSETLISKWNVSQNETALLYLDELSTYSREVGDKSYLILDPDLDTYYLMDAVLLRLPKNQELLFRTNLLMDKLTVNNALSPLEENELRGYLSALENNLAEIDRGLDVGMGNNENGAMTISIQDAFDEYRSAIEAYSFSVSQKISDQQFIDSQELLSLYESSRKESSEFYDTASAGLENGIQNRVNTQGRQLAAFLMLSAVSFFVAATIGYRMLSALRAPLQKTIEAAEQFSAGNTSFRIQYEARDEFDKVIQAFNQMAG